MIKDGKEAMNYFTHLRANTGEWVSSFSVVSNGTENREKNGLLDLGWTTISRWKNLLPTIMTTRDS
jgi:hypothetical protein